MPEQRITKEAILAAALSVVRAHGDAALTARAVAQEANCSVQPVYSLFGDMDGLVRALYEYARLWVADYHRSHEGDGANPFEANGLSHLRLAREESQLFGFLYLSSHMGAHSLEDMYRSVSLEQVEQCIQEFGGLSAEAAHELYLNMIIYVHGLAVGVAVGAQFSNEELASRMHQAFLGFLSLVR